MSTVITNAYRISVPPEESLISFARSLSREYLDASFKSYCAVVADYAIKISEEIVIRRYLDPTGSYTEMRDDIIKKLHIRLDGRRTREETLEEFTPGELAIMLADDYVRKAYNLDGSPKLAMFDAPGPRSHNEHLIIAFGNDFAHMMENIESDASNAIRRKFRISEYDYSDQADKPDKISDAEWKERRKTWEKSMPNGSAARDGIVLDICSHLTLAMHIAENIDKIYPEVKNIFDSNPRYADPETRITNYARALAAEGYVKSSGEYDPKGPDANNIAYRLTMEYLRGLDEKRPEMISRLERVKHDIDEFFKIRRNNDKSVDTDKLSEPLKLE